MQSYAVLCVAGVSHADWGLHPDIMLGSCLQVLPGLAAKTAHTASLEPLHTRKRTRSPPSSVGLPLLQAPCKTWA